MTQANAKHGGESLGTQLAEVRHLFPQGGASAGQEANAPEAAPATVAVEAGGKAKEARRKCTGNKGCGCMACFKKRREAARDRHRSEAVASAPSAAHDAIPAAAQAAQDQAVEAASQRGRFQAPQFSAGKPHGKQQGKPVAKQHLRGEPSGKRSLQVEKRAKRIDAIGIGGYEWTERDQKVCFHMKDTPYGELIIMVEAATSRRGIHTRVLRHLPRESATVEVNTVSCGGIWVDKKPQVFEMVKTPFGRVQFIVEMKDGAPFARAL